MIHISRRRLDGNGSPIQPDDRWVERAQSATAQAQTDGSDHQVSALYREVAVTAALEELFHRKCAYCETSISNQSWDVEHYRPKGRVAERRDHPGYYWLAYTWSNLYPACEFCNQRRRDKPVWGDLRYADTAGKLDQFPLEDESARALDHQGDTGAERPLLLDPCAEDDDPEEHLRYDVQGQIHATPGDPRAAATIAICHLHRRRLRDLRREKIDMTTRLLTSIAKARNAGNEDLARDLESYVAEFLCADSAEHAGAARFVRRDPASFGL